MVKVWLRQKTVKLGHSGVFHKVKFQKFLQSWWRYDYDNKIRPFWVVSESQISKFSSTIAKVWLRQKTAKLAHSEPTAPADPPQADVYFHLFFRAITTFFGQKIAQPPPQIFWARAPMLFWIAKSLGETPPPQLVVEADFQVILTVLSQYFPKVTIEYNIYSRLENQFLPDFPDFFHFQGNLTD